jgi:hypothetical protein
MPLSFRLPLPFGLIPLNQNPEWQALGFEKYIFAGRGKILLPLNKYIIYANPVP